MPPRGENGRRAWAISGERAEGDDDRSNRGSGEPVQTHGPRGRNIVRDRVADPIWASGHRAASTDPMRASGGQLIVSADKQSLEDPGHGTGVWFNYVSDRPRLR